MTIEGLWYQMYDARGNPPPCRRLCRLPWAEQWPLIPQLAAAMTTSAGWRQTTTRINEVYWYWPHPLSPSGWWMIPHRIDRRARALHDAATMALLRDPTRCGSVTGSDVARLLRRWQHTRHWQRAGLDLRSHLGVRLHGDSCHTRLYQRAAQGERVELWEWYPQRPDPPKQHPLRLVTTDLTTRGRRRSRVHVPADRHHRGYMHHVTLSTGHHRWSPQSEVDPRLMDVLRRHLADLLQSDGPVSIPGVTESITAEAVVSGDVIAITIRYTDYVAPIVTFVVVPAGNDADAAARRVDPQSPVALPLSGPWCLVRLYPTLALVPRDDIEWLGDYERCVAWAWLEQPAQTRSH